MSVYRRGKFYWIDFVRKGKRHQFSTKQSSRRAALDIQARVREQMARGDYKVLERTPAPTLKDFAPEFIHHVQTHAKKPGTAAFYQEKLSRLLEHEPLARAKLDDINEKLIGDFAEWRRSQPVRFITKKGRQSHPTRVIQPGSVNRSLATLRKLLRLAHERAIIDRVPRIRLLGGERSREFVLDHSQEQRYLEACSQPLRDFATLDLDTGMRAGEAVALRWDDVHLEPASGAHFGYVHIREGKTKNARRNIPLTDRAKEVLEQRRRENAGEFVFGGGRPYRPSSLSHSHHKVRARLKMPPDFVLHCLRHSFGTRLGESGADPFTIMRLMGHSSTVVSERYVHPTPESIERAVGRLQSLNRSAAASAASPESSSACSYKGVERDERPDQAASLNVKGLASLVRL